LPKEHLPMRSRMALTAPMVLLLCVACGGGHGLGSDSGNNSSGNSPPPVTPEADRSWQTALPVQQDEAHAEEGAQLAINTHGTATLIWRQGQVGDAVQIWASRYTPESKTWSVPTRLGPQGGGVVLGADVVPGVAIAENGEAVAVWPQQVNDVNEIWGT